MKTVKIALIAIILATTCAFAQDKNAEAKVEIPDFNLTFNCGDTYVIFLALSEIQILGKEAAVYLKVQELFAPELAKITAGESKAEDSFSITLPANMANALYTFVNRATVSAKNAERFVNFKKVIEAEAKKISDELEKNK